MKEQLRLFIQKRRALLDPYEDYGHYLGQEEELDALEEYLDSLPAPVADERAAFEAAYKRRQGTPIDLKLLRDGNRYTDGADGAHNLNVAWETWQDARAALASAPVAEEAQKPVEYLNVDQFGNHHVCGPDIHGAFPVYAAPQASKEK